MQADDPAKKGVCSNYLCDAKPGDEIKVTGPSGTPPAVRRSPRAAILTIAPLSYAGAWKREVQNLKPPVLEMKGLRCGA